MPTKKNSRHRHSANTQHVKTQKHHHKTTTRQRKHSIVMAPMLGGSQPYLARLRAKGDQPITGADLDRAMTEIMTIMRTIQYTSEGRQFSTSNVLLDYFNGNEQALESYLRYQIIPKYASVFPPYINITAIINKLNEIGFIADAYLKDAEYKRQALIDSGVDPATLEDENTFLKRVVGDISRASGKLHQVRSQARLARTFI